MSRMLNVFIGNRGKSPLKTQRWKRVHRKQCLLPQNMIWKQAVMYGETPTDHLKD